MPPELSVIVPTHNRRERLRSCLDSLGCQTASADLFEVVVVVDGSTDGTSEMLAKLVPAYRLSVVTQQQAGVSAARNAGAARAAGRILLFIDDDEEAGPALVASHLELHRGQSKLAGVGRIVQPIPPEADRVARMRGESTGAHFAELGAAPLTWDSCYSGNCSVARSTFEEVGGFATDLPRENDTEFAYRLHRAGVDFRFLADGVVTEHRTQTWRQIVADVELRGRIAVELYRRHPGMVEKMELGEYWFRPPRWIVLRRLALALGLPPRVFARLGFLLPREWARRWIRFTWNYAYWSGVKAASDRDLWRRLRRGTLILLYHAFGHDGEPPSRYVVSGRSFARQMRLLKLAGYNVITLAEFVECRRAHRFPPPRSVVITIDDGYLDNDTVARPILERLGLGATVFLITAAGGRNPTASDPVLAARPLLDLARSRAMLGSTIQFGAHTRTHADLTGLELEAAVDEVLGSKQDLERAFGVPVGHFAYPFGEISNRAREVVEQAGFWSACGIKPGFNGPVTDQFDLRRVEVRGTQNLVRFAATLLLGDVSRLGLRRPKRRAPGSVG